MGLGGISSDGIFGTLPAWVDAKLAPGYSDQTNELGFRKTLRSCLTLGFFFMSPNLTWFTIALSMHCCFPYPIEEARMGFALKWCALRLVLNYSVAFSYYAFFHVGLYWRGWGSRKYTQNMPTWGNMAHNLWYWSLGVVQWTCWECLMCRLYARGLVRFMTDEEVLNDANALALNALWVLLTPLWRDLHFYIAHRFIHIRAICELKLPGVEH